jgi:MFS family permease
MRTLVRGLVPAGALLSGLLAERIGLRGVMIASVLGGPLAFLVIWCSPVRALLTPPERMDYGRPQRRSRPSPITHHPSSAAIAARIASLIWIEAGPTAASMLPSARSAKVATVIPARSEGRVGLLSRL